MMLVLAEALLVIGLLVLVGYLAHAALTRTTDPEERPSLPPGHWEAAHSAAGGATRVVVRRRALSSGLVLDEHEVAVIPDTDPAYDQKFLAAMALARERAALFESES